MRRAFCKQRIANTSSSVRCTDGESRLLIYTAPTKFDVDLGDLIDVYEAGETKSISVAVSDGTITATLKVSSEAENQLQIKSDGAYVPPLSWQTVEGA